MVLLGDSPRFLQNSLSFGTLSGWKFSSISRKIEMLAFFLILKWILMYFSLLKLLFVLMCFYRFKCKLTKLHLKLLTFKFCWITGAIPLVLLLGSPLFTPLLMASHPLKTNNKVVLHVPALSLCFGRILTLLGESAFLRHGIARGGLLVVLWGVAVAVSGGPLMTLLLALVGQILVKDFYIWHLQSHPSTRINIKRRKKMLMMGGVLLLMSLQTSLMYGGRTWMTETFLALLALLWQLKGPLLYCFVILDFYTWPMWSFSFSGHCPFDSRGVTSYHPSFLWICIFILI